MYNAIVQTFMFQHTIPANILSNGVVYRFTVRTADINNVWSEFSNSIIAMPISPPILTIINLLDGIVGGQSYLFQGSFYQENGEILESYRFNLYDMNGVLLLSSSTKYDQLIQHQFDMLNNNTYYNIDFNIKTINGFEYRSPMYSFFTQYLQPLIENSVYLVNIPEIASIQISSQVIRLLFLIGEGEVLYEDDEWANLKNGMIYLEDGFKLNSNFTIRLWLKDIREDVSFLKLYSRQGYIELKVHSRYGKRKIYAYKKAYKTDLQYITFSDEIEYSNSDTLFIYFQQENDFLYIKTEVI